MTRDDIIRKAQEAGFDYSGAELSWESVICTEELERFAALVASAEREACDFICKEYYEWANSKLEDGGPHFAGRMRAAQDIGNSIRARGQA